MVLARDRVDRPTSFPGLFPLKLRRAGKGKKGKSPGNEVVPKRLKEMPDYLYNTIIITNKTILSYATKNNTNTTIKYNYL